jgi:hypothetical protein
VHIYIFFLIILSSFSCEKIQKGSSSLSMVEEAPIPDYLGIMHDQRPTSVYLNIEPTEIVFDGKARANEFLKESTLLLRTGADDLKVYDLYLKSDDPTNPNIDAINAQLKNCDRIKAGLPEVITTADLRECPVMLYQYNRGQPLPMIVKADQINTLGEEVAVIYRNYQDMPEVPANLQIVIDTNVPDAPLRTVDIKFQSTPAQINVNTTAVSFRQGQAGSNNIIISNLGGEDLELTNITVNQTTPFDGTKEFDVTATSGAPILAVIPPMGSFSLTVRYTPQNGDIDRGEILIESTDLANSPITVSLTSEPVLNFLSLSANVMKFKQTPNFTDSKILTFRNVGLSNINVNGFSFEPANPDLKLDKDSFQLSGGQSIDLQVSYRPTSADPLDSTLVIRTNADNAVDGEMRVRLFSENTQVNALSSDKVAILVSAVAEGQSKENTITLTCDSGTVNISEIAFKEGSDPDFTITAGGEAGTLNERDTRSLKVNFTRAAGDQTSRKATVVVKSDSVAGDIEISFLANP